MIKVRFSVKVINVKVIPNAKKNRIIQQEGILRVYLTSPPVDGKANKLLIKILSEYFKVKKSGIRIKRGVKAKHKSIEINL